MKRGDRLYYIDMGEVKWRMVDKVGRKYIHLGRHLKVGVIDLVEKNDWGSKARFYHSSESAQYAIDEAKSNRELRRVLESNRYSVFTTGQCFRIIAILNEETKI